MLCLSDLCVALLPAASVPVHPAFLCRISQPGCFLCIPALAPPSYLASCLSCYESGLLKGPRPTLLLNLVAFFSALTLLVLPVAWLLGAVAAVLSALCLHDTHLTSSVWHLSTVTQAYWLASSLTSPLFFRLLLNLPNINPILPLGSSLCSFQSQHTLSSPLSSSSGLLHGILPGWLVEFCLFHQVLTACIVWDI